MLVRRGARCCSRVCFPLVVRATQKGTVKAKTLQLSLLVLASLTLRPVDADNNCVALPSSVIAWWPGDGVALDVAGPNHGILQNGAAYAPGLAGQVFSFDGVNDYVSVPDSDSWAFGTNDFTIELWAQFASSTGTRALLASDTGPGTQNKWIFGRDGSFLRF